MDIYTVIDGQKRMTTVSLMWIALYQLYKEKKKLSNDHMANAIWELFNFNSLSDDTESMATIYVRFRNGR